MARSNSFEPYWKAEIRIVPTFIICTPWCRYAVIAGYLRFRGMRHSLPVPCVVIYKEHKVKLINYFAARVTTVINIQCSVMMTYNESNCSTNMLLYYTNELNAYDEKDGYLHQSETNTYRSRCWIDSQGSTCTFDTLAHKSISNSM
jgi:hypothetical protein